ncbi:MAG: helix-turn-helix domain-containing protein, partial [Halobacteria archaeon]|nr:helix-turn-helix domain-containing protein [Halobacteria archaeon]
MPKAKLVISLPEGTWIRDISTSYPDAVFRVVSALAGEEYGVGIVEVESDEIEDILSEMREHPVLA